MNAPTLTAECVPAYTQVMETTAKTATTANLHTLGTAYLRARAKMETAHAALRDGMRDAARTTSELQIAKATGVTRQTVRKALGK